MDESASSVQSQYAHGALLDAIDSALAEAGASHRRPKLADLAPVDEFHIRGRQATRELLEGVSLSEGATVLDVGCGIGGTARHLADEYGVKVLGVDLSEEYCAVARELTRRVGLEDRVSVRQGNALDLPVDDEQFDLVVSEHVQMNVSDKSGYVGEMTRVLKPGGTLALHEIFAGQQAPFFPVPWADDSSVSFLVEPERFRRKILKAGLDLLRWEDRTEAGREWFEHVLDRVRREGPPPIGLHLLMGASAKEKMKNVLRNLTDGRIEIVLARAHKPV